MGTGQSPFECSKGKKRQAVDHLIVNTGLEDIERRRGNRVSKAMGAEGAEQNGDAAEERPERSVTHGVETTSHKAEIRNGIRP